MPPHARSLVLLAAASLAVACGRVGYDPLCTPFPFDAGDPSLDGSAPRDARDPDLDAALDPDAATLVPGTLSVSAGEDHTCAVRDGRVFCWGNGENGELGVASLLLTTTPEEVALPALAAWVGAASEHTCALTVAGETYCWGRNDFGQLGENGASSIADVPTTPVVSLASPTDLDVGGRHSAAVRVTSRVVSWGDNGSGQLGDGTSAGARFAPVDTRFNAIDVDAGDAHTCAIRMDRTLRCWGSNTYGQLGDGSGRDQNSPVTVPDMTSVTAVSAGGRHTCAITGDRGAFCWGAGDLGQLSDGEPPSSTPGPTPVLALPEPAVEIAAGGLHTCARAASGAVYCWGDNATGQLGDGSTTERHAPVRVTGLPVAASLSLGASHSCATTTDGRVFCWGDGADGRLGDGGTSVRTAPVEIDLP
ncbi:regulator of chromosome condensation RCC1 [Sandaracinus amylolyticus]|uniref:Regulator of chromosome condensation RCC1 n=1 Tax=Sandaracinus amylolyticus TaxID=927083 RepID=A0A0F6YMH7_9BACT|nr:regulator of chromosome condensation RCC1 [Sandaracinus amylolyticus]